MFADLNCGAIFEAANRLQRSLVTDFVGGRAITTLAINVEDSVVPFPELAVSALGMHVYTYRRFCLTRSLKCMHSKLVCNICCTL